MLKILHLINSLNRGGIEMWLLSMLRQIPRNQYQMDFCCKGQNVGALANIAEELGAKVFHCQLNFAHFGFINNLKRIIIEGNYQILHNHLEAYSGLGTWLGNELGIPVITSFHNTKFFTPQTPLTRRFVIRQLRSIYAKFSIRYALENSHLVTGCSQGVIDSLTGFDQNIKNSGLVLNYGVNIPDLATPEKWKELRNSFGWTEDTPIILHVGRLIEQKNHLGLLSIFQKVVEKIPTAKLLLVGEGPLRGLITENITKLGLINAVKLLGLRDDIPALMTCANVFLFPSFHEGLPVVSLEANAAGLPIVGSKIPGLIEAVKDRETAILHEVEDLEGMAKSTIDIINNRQYAQDLAQAGRAWIKSKYSTENSAKRLIEIYHNCLIKT